jgi:hypothetical protein
MTLRKAILAALDNVHPHMEPEAALVADANALTGRVHSMNDVRAECGRLITQGWVAGLTSAGADPVMKYRITDEGRGALTEP